MQRHVPYHKQIATFPRLRRELELISEARRLSDSGSSDAKRQNQNRESHPVARVCFEAPLFYPHCCCGHSHVRKVTITRVNDVFP